MKIQQSQLYKALQIAGRAVSANGIVPATSCYLFTLSKNTLTIEATNMKFHIATSLDVEADDCCFMINASLLNGLISTLAEQPINFEIAEKAVTIKYNKNGKTAIPIEDGKDFPKPISGKKPQTGVINSSVFLNGFKRTAWAVAKDRKDKMELESLNMVFTNNQVKFNAADGFKVASYQFEAEHSINANILVPNYCIDAFSLPEDTELAVIVSDSSISIQYTETKVNISLYDGKYPPIEKMIPVNQPNMVKVAKSEIMPVISRIKSFANKNTKGLKLSFSADTISLCGEDIDFSHTSEETLSVDYSGEELTIGINADILTETLKSMGSDVYLHFTAHNRPVTVYDHDGNTNENVTLVMPIA